MELIGQLQEIHSQLESQIQHIKDTKSKFYQMYQELDRKIQLSIMKAGLHRKRGSTAGNLLHRTPGAAAIRAQARSQAK